MPFVTIRHHSSLWYDVQDVPEGFFSVTQPSCGGGAVQGPLTVTNIGVSRREKLKSGAERRLPPDVVIVEVLINGHPLWIEQGLVALIAPEEAAKMVMRKHHSSSERTLATQETSTTSTSMPTTNENVTVTEGKKKLSLLSTPDRGSELFCCKNNMHCAPDCKFKMEAVKELMEMFPAFSHFNFPPETFAMFAEIDIKKPRACALENGAKRSKQAKQKKAKKIKKECCSPPPPISPFDSPIFTHSFFPQSPSTSFSTPPPPPPTSFTPFMESDSLGNPPPPVLFCRQLEGQKKPRVKNEGKVSSSSSLLSSSSSSSSSSLPLMVRLRCKVGAGRADDTLQPQRGSPEKDIELMATELHQKATGTRNYQTNNDEKELSPTFDEDEDEENEENEDEEEKILKKKPFSQYLCIYFIEFISCFMIIKQHYKKDGMIERLLLLKESKN